MKQHSLQGNRVKPSEAMKAICAIGSVEPTLAKKSGVSSERNPRWGAYRSVLLIPGSSRRSTAKAR
jgi:hypothetical protein